MGDKSQNSIQASRENFIADCTNSNSLHGSDYCNCAWNYILKNYSKDWLKIASNSSEAKQKAIEINNACKQYVVKPTITPQPTLTSGQIITKFEKEAQIVTVTQIYKTPNSYKGKSLIFTCSVSGFPKDDNGDVAALNCDDLNDFSSNVQIAIGKEIDVTKINHNDTLKVYGMGLGALTGKNGFGADITTGAILGLYINDLTTGYKNY